MGELMVKKIPSWINFFGATSSWHQGRYVYFESLDGRGRVATSQGIYKTDGWRLWESIWT